MLLSPQIQHVQTQLCIKKERKKEEKPLLQQPYFYSDEGLGHVTLTKVEGD